MKVELLVYQSFIPGHAINEYPTQIGCPTLPLGCVLTYVILYYIMLFILYYVGLLSCILGCNYLRGSFICILECKQKR